jgi:hypothetical protein
LALLLFAMLGCVLIFGTRTTGRYWATWLLLLACWPLPYQMIGSTLGGGTEVYALMNVGISAAAIWVALGGRLAPRLAYAGATFLLGAGATRAMAGRPAMAVELVPAAVAAVIVAGWVVVRRRQRPDQRASSARDSLAVKKPRAGYLAILAAAILLGVFSHTVPASVDSSSLAVTGPGWMPQPVVPTAWNLGSTQRYAWAPQFFGDGAGLTRYWFKSSSQTAAPLQRVVVDALTTSQTGPLSVYPVIATYRLASPYIQSPQSVPLGHHVVATLFYANPSTAVDPVQTEWVLLTWTWRVQRDGHTTYQRLTVITTDGTPTTAAIPAPSAPWSNGSVRLVFEDALRGLPSPSSTPPSAAALHRLTGFARQIVATQSSGTSR